jgi:signal transduction histidine kinase
VVTVSVVCHVGQVDVEVSDDGIGGADAERGTGPRGLQDRVAALDGGLELTSADGKAPC